VQIINQLINQKMNKFKSFFWLLYIMTLILGSLTVAIFCAYRYFHDDEDLATLYVGVIFTVICILASNFIADAINYFDRSWFKRRSKDTYKIK
jgi:hypothetical protein